MSTTSGKFSAARGYCEVLLEEIALEGLDGITLETLWKRLQYNPDWKLFPIDDYVEQFIWKHLLSLREVEWFALPKPRTCPRLFATFDELVDATTKGLDLLTYSSDNYAHFPINDNGIMGSCPTYHQRTNVTQEIQSYSIAKAKKKWGNKLVIVASQAVRNSVLLPHDENPELQLADTSYCILERIGRARRCGETSLSLHFLRNGANPTFYFWSKLRKRKIICSQVTYGSNGRTTNTLFHLPQFYKKNMEGVCSAIEGMINDIKASSQKACLFADMKEKYFPLKPKITKTEYFKRSLKVDFMDYDEFYNSGNSVSNTPNACKKVLRVIKLAEQNPEPIVDAPMDVDEDETVILKENRILNKPLLSQCFSLIDEAGAEGISMVDIGSKLGVTRLVARQLVRTLSKHDLLMSLSSDDARKRFYRFFSKRFSEQVTLKMQEHLDISMDTLGTNIDRVRPEDSEENTSSTTSKVGISECSNRPPDEIRNNNASPNKRPLSCEKNESNGDAKRRKLNETKTKSDSAKNKQNEKTQCLIPANESIFVMRRVNIIMKEVNERRALPKYDIPRMVHNEETRRNLNQGYPDRKSIARVLDLLEKKGRIKIIKTLVTNEARNKSRKIEFVCVPDVDENHSVIVAAIEEAKHDLAITYVKKGSQSWTTNSAQTYHLASRKSSRRGYAPKFSRMKLLHELLVYIVYQYEGDENLDQDECKKYLSPLFVENDRMKDDLPKCYTKEIGWKMFIPRLMEYEEYQKGWLSQSDLADRLPLKLFLALIHSRFENPEVDLYLQHPIKQYYLLRHLPRDMQEYLTVDNSYMYSLHLNFRNLCMIGLTQFGPKTKTRGSQNLVYVNKRTQLLDTRSCPPAHLQINASIDYPRSDYDFTQPGDLERYWNNAMRFCLGTKLGRRKVATTAKTSLANKVMSDALRDSLTARSIDEAPSLDVGDVPGDRLGAGGYDSWHYSHFIKQWMMNKTSDKATKSAARTSSKSSVARNVAKSRVFRNLKTIRNISLKKCDRRTKFDKVDAEALKRLKTLRATWRKNEDEVLLLCHVASQYYNAGSFPSYKPYKLFRKLLHKSSDTSACKTRDAVKRRLNNLMKNSLRKHNVEILIKEITEDENFKEKLKDTIDELEKCIAEKQNIEDALDKLTEEVFYHLYNNKTSVLKRGSEITLPNNIETFRQEWNYEYAVGENIAKNVREVNDKEDAVVLVIINLSLSTLLSQVEKDKVLNINFLFKTFKLFDDDQVRLAHNFLRSKRLISYNKSNERQRSAYVPFGKGVYHLSITYHIILKAAYHLNIFAQVYANYLEMVSKWDCENVELTNYESGYNLLLVSLLTASKISFEIFPPEYVLTFTKPAIIDPAEVSKPTLEAKSAYMDETLSLIRDSFFKNKSDLPKEISTKNLNNLDSSDDGDSEADIGDEVNDIEDNSIDCSSSKLAIFITRSNLKHSEMRFSNAYDNFLINPFRLKCNVNGGDPKCDTLVVESRENFLKRVEENASYSAIKYSTDELMLKIRKLFRKPNHRDCAIGLLEFLTAKGACGATYETLKNEFHDITLLKKITDTLLQKKLLIRNGSRRTHFVHLDFAEYWLLKSYKNKNIVCDETDSNSATPAVINRRSLDETEKMNEYCESVWVSIRPWVYLNGTINVPALESFLIRVLSFVVRNPGCCLMQIQKKFSPALQPHLTRELVEFLQQLKCLQMQAVVVNRKETLFTKLALCSVPDCATGFEDEQDIILDPDANALVKLSIFIGNVNYKDLLELKSYDTRNSNEEIQNVSEMDIQNSPEDNDKTADGDEI